MTQKLLTLKRNLLIMIIINTLLFQNLKSFQQKLLIRRLKQADLVTKTDFDDKVKSQNQIINSNKTKHLLVENELEKLKTFDLSYFKSKSHFEEGRTQNYLVFQTMYRYFELIANTKYISE